MTHIIIWKSFAKRGRNSRSKQWYTEGNVNRGKKDGFRKLTDWHKKKIVYCNNNEIIEENKSTKFPGNDKSNLRSLMPLITGIVVWDSRLKKNLFLRTFYAPFTFSVQKKSIVNCFQSKERATKHKNIIIVVASFFQERLIFLNSQHNIFNLMCFFYITGYVMFLVIISHLWCHFTFLCSYQWKKFVLWEMICR